MKKLDKFLPFKWRGVLFITVLTFGLGVTVTGLAQQDPVQPENALTSEEDDSFKLVRLVTEAPVYPKVAERMQLEGWVDVLVTVDNNGKVEKVAVVAAQPRRIFERAALRAAKNWQFEPPTDSGINIPQQALYRITFKLN